MKAVSPSVGYKAWILDLDGTLYSPKPLKFAMAAELAFSGWKHIRLIRDFRHAHELVRHSIEHLQSDGDQSTPFQRQLAITANELAMPVEHVRSVTAEWMIHRPCKWLRLFRRRWLIDQIRWFRSNGGMTAVVSDYPAIDKLRAMNTGRLFDIVVSNGESHSPSELKPSPDGILTAIRELDVEPGEALMIGDRSDCDGAAAMAAGVNFWNVRTRKIERRGRDSSEHVTSQRKVAALSEPGSALLGK